LAKNPGETSLPPFAGSCILMESEDAFHGSRAQSMSTLTEIQERNRTLARQINEEARADPQSPYAGKLVGIANGQVAVVADDWDALAVRLHQIEPDPRKTYCLEAGRDYDAVEMIWRVLGWRA
jgi:hypothetical protein